MPKKEKDSVVGAKIVKIRPMTGKEMSSEMWDEDNFGSNPPAIVLDNGTVIYPSRDDEGNGGGALFGYSKDGTQFGIR